MKKKYPSSGDSGRAKLSSGRLAGKDNIAFEVSGSLDELNSMIGWSRAACDADELDTELKQIQNDIFELSGVITGWTESGFSSEHVSRLEYQIREMEAKVSDTRKFVLPGGSEFASRLHVVRSTVRRVERRIAGLEEADKEVLRYINRLSDWFYLAARMANASSGCEEDFWCNPDVKE